MWLFHCAREQFVNSPLRWCWWWWVRSGWTASCTPYNWKPSLRPFYLSRIAHKFRRTIHATSVSVSVRNDCQCATTLTIIVCSMKGMRPARADGYRHCACVLELTHHMTKLLELWSLFWQKLICCKARWCTCIFWCLWRWLQLCWGLQRARQNASARTTPSASLSPPNHTRRSWHL